jgi:hypothetical protein
MLVAQDRAEVVEILAAAAVTGREKAEIYEGAAALDEFTTQYPGVALLTTL